MHFGKIVKKVAHSHGFSAADVAELLGRSEKQVLQMYEQEEWTSGTIRAVSLAMEHDFGQYLSNSHNFEFFDVDEPREYFHIIIRYSKGKEFLLKTWLQKISLIAKTIGLEIRK